MEFKRCSKGHVYNPMENATCPVCAAEGGMDTIGATAPAGGMGGMGGMDTIGATAPVGGIGATAPIGGIGATAPVGGYGAPNPVPGGYGVQGPTQPPTKPGFTPSVFAGYDNSAASGYNPFYSGSTVGGMDTYPEATQAVNMGGVPGFSPVVGWLVCIEGADKGTDYRIHNGNNYIGRSPSMDISIRNDMQVSNENQANVGYDDIDRVFFFGPSTGRNTVRVNGKMVINTVQLEPYDIVTVGSTKLIFIPLCGERFDWNEKK